MPRALGWLIVLTLLGGVAAIIIDRVAGRMFNGDTDRPSVLALPRGYGNPPNLPPYAGPHPRQMQWPEERFAFPIRPGQTGPVQPLFSGPLQYPFLCRTLDGGLGHPLVDNQRGEGMAVLSADGQRIGYSRDCLLPTQVSYFGLDDQSGDFVPLEPGRPPPDLVVRVELGTINRFVYLIAVPTDPKLDEIASPDLTRWNGKLVYYFRGGVGIGYRQGRVYPPTILKRRLGALRNGYAVAYSSGNQTSNTYNIWLNADTAMRVKRQFESAYAAPRYTVGIGGSGGAIQQYLIAQNFPGLLDAAIALYSYPDMVSQSTYVLDCELLEYYFDRVADAPRWRSVAERALVEGASYDPDRRPEFYPMYPLSDLLAARWPRWPDGANECTAAWRGATPLVINPRYAHFADRYSDPVRRATDWSYFGDLRRWFGTDELGFGNRTWDNTGVQYGLKALRDGGLSAEEFLHLNESIGGWLPAGQMQPPRYWKSAMAPSALNAFSPWSHHNQVTGRRSRASTAVIAAGWQSGQVFAGYADIPIIDLRHYLDPELDMHHAVSSFQARARLLEGQGHADNQLIWVTRPDHQPYAEALDLIDRWLTRKSQGLGAPEDATDRCYSADGALLASGSGVWDGSWNGKPEGACTRRYPPLGTSRIAAGAPLSGDIFQCALKGIDDALADGTYGAVNMTAHRARLQAIFPDGVCDYSQPDTARPANWRLWFEQE